MTSAVDHLVTDRHIIVCCGSGGVGKTTTAAAMAVEGARRGRDTVVVTIDPAKRLANALGLESLSDTASEIDRSLWDPAGEAPASGRLSALMLDTKSTFDRLVAKYAGGEEQARRIIDNRFYRNVSTALSGTQEYMAMEKLHELHEDGSYDLIVVDTPPSRNALDFLDAPHRLTRFLDHRLVRILLFPTRATLRVATVAAQSFFRTISKVVGGEVVQDAVAFFQAFEGMEEGFRDRAQGVLELLAEPASAFVLVTSPRRDAVEEAFFFGARLAENDVPVQGIVVNRIHPFFGEEVAEGLYARAQALGAGMRSGAGDGAGGGAPVGADAAPAGEAALGEAGVGEAGAGEAAGEAAARLAALYRNLADFQQVAALERRVIEDLAAEVERAEGTPAPVGYVPFLSDDVHDVGGLEEVARHLFGRADGDGGATGAAASRGGVAPASGG